jgi:hypothetical protein
MLMKDDLFLNLIASIGGLATALFCWEFRRYPEKMMVALLILSVYLRQKF